MTFGPVPVARAQGGILAHSLHQGALRLRKGRVLSDADIAALREAGVTEVTVAMLAPDDVEENTAAARVAQALVDQSGGAVELTAPFTGRVNIVAKEPGLAHINVEAVNALNACDPMITCATVAPFTRMAAGGLIATIKIISYGVSSKSLELAERTEQAIGLIPVALTNARLIVTQTGAETNAQKGVDAIRKRLDALAMRLDEVITIGHDTASIAQAISEATQDLVLILTASATSDPADVGPEALRKAGGKVERFGMPVDPGNLLFFGQWNGKPVIGLPGCARSPALNGADWVLERVACGVDVSAEDIAAMGVGGLLKEIPQRPQPRLGKPKA